METKKQYRARMRSEQGPDWYKKSQTRSSPELHARLADEEGWPRKIRHDSGFTLTRGSESENRTKDGFYTGQIRWLSYADKSYKAAADEDTPFFFVDTRSGPNKTQVSASWEKLSDGEYDTREHDVLVGTQAEAIEAIATAWAPWRDR